MKIFTGIVISVRDTTAVVEVERVTIHPKYKKRLIRVRKYHVDDKIGVKSGQKVHFVETRPISKTKKWKIIK